jgi:hypothetical protein
MFLPPAVNIASISLLTCQPSPAERGLCLHILVFDPDPCISGVLITAVSAVNLPPSLTCQSSPSKRRASMALSDPETHVCSVINVANLPSLPTC